MSTIRKKLSGGKWNSIGAAREVIDPGLKPDISAARFEEPSVPLLPLLGERRMDSEKELN